MTNPLAFILSTGLVLADCPDSPNCVCSWVEPSDSHYVAPLQVENKTDVIKRLAAVINTMPRSTITEESPQHLHAEFRSWLFGFVDDLDCILDEQGSVVHIRSASRTGYYDFGVNRKRVEAIRAKWLP
jgi:uncharacterized protein (DUF1499 family)